MGYLVVLCVRWLDRACTEIWCWPVVARHKLVCTLPGNCCGSISLIISIWSMVFPLVHVKLNSMRVFGEVVCSFVFLSSLRGCVLVYMKSASRLPCCILWHCRGRQQQIAAVTFVSFYIVNGPHSLMSFKRSVVLFFCFFPHLIPSPHSWGSWRDRGEEGRSRPPPFQAGNNCFSGSWHLNICFIIGFENFFKKITWNRYFRSPKVLTTHPPPRLYGETLQT